MFVYQPHYCDNSFSIWLKTRLYIDLSSIYGKTTRMRSKNLNRKVQKCKTNAMVWFYDLKRAFDSVKTAIMKSEM